MCADIGEQNSLAASRFVATGINAIAERNVLKPLCIQRRNSLPVKVGDVVQGVIVVFANPIPMLVPVCTGSGPSVCELV